MSCAACAAHVEGAIKKMLERDTAAGIPYASMVEGYTVSLLTNSATFDIGSAEKGEPGDGDIATLKEKLGEALKAGVEKVMDKAGSKPGEKTILDALVPAVDAICTHAGEGFDAALKAAADAAAKGSDSTANMPAVHGRAAYYGDKAIGLIDGGSIVGRMIFEALAQSRA